MQVAIDARIAYYNSSGIDRYLTGLLDGFDENSLDSIELTLLQSWRSYRNRDSRPGINGRFLLTPPHFRYEGALLDLELKRFDIDLLHCVDFFAPTSGAPLLLTILDLHFLREPQCMSPESYRHYSKLLDFIPRAEHIVCISESTKSDLMELAGVKEDRVSVIYPGFAEPSFDLEQGVHDALTLKCGFDGAITLAVGTLEPRKNYLNAIAAYIEAYRQIGDDLPPLIVAGRVGYRGNEVLQALNGAENEAPIRYLGEVSELELRALYARAKILLYPSLCEGFGFPLLEAMASSTSIVTSNCSSMLEIAGEAAFFVEPNESESIACGLIAAAKEYDKASAKLAIGKEIAKGFTWEKSSSKHLELYRQIAER